MAHFHISCLLEGTDKIWSTLTILEITPSENCLPSSSSNALIQYGTVVDVFPKRTLHISERIHRERSQFLHNVPSYMLKTVCPNYAENKQLGMLPRVQEGLSPFLSQVIQCSQVELLQQAKTPNFSAIAFACDTQQVSCSFTLQNTWLTVRRMRSVSSQYIVKHGHQCWWTEHRFSLLPTCQCWFSNPLYIFN